MGMAPPTVMEHAMRERRQQPRLRLTVPVLCGTAAGHERGRDLPHAGWSKDLSAEGVYALLRDGHVFAPGDILAIDVEIPWDARRAFPFSRIAGTARVVRVDRLPGTSPDSAWGVALAFCPDVTRLGAMPPS